MNFVTWQLYMSYGLTDTVLEEMNQGKKKE